MVDVLLIVIMVAIAGYLVMSKMKPKAGKQSQNNKAPQAAPRPGSGRSAPAPAQRPRPMPQPQAPAQVPAAVPVASGGWAQAPAQAAGWGQGPVHSVGRAPVAAPVFGAAPERAATVYLAEPVRVTLEVTAGVDRGTRFVLAPGDNHVGRAPNSAVRLMDSTVSNQHAIIRIDGSDVLLFDNASTNGTFVGHEQVLTPRPLADGQEIRMGNTTVVVRI